MINFFSSPINEAEISSQKPVYYLRNAVMREKDVNFV